MKRSRKTGGERIDELELATSDEGFGSAEEPGWEG
jgi:hypothetical protein